MLGYLAAKLPSPASPPGLDWLTTVGMLMSVGLLGASFVMLYRTAFPILAGGQGSIIYFRAIAGRSASEFAAAYAAADEALVRADLTEQIWRNSVILRQKYDRLKRAYLLLAASVLPWAFTVWRVTRIS